MWPKVKINYNAFEALKYKKKWNEYYNFETK